MQTEMLDQTDIDSDEIITLLVLMIMGVSERRWWGAYDVARCFEVSETEARMILNDLEDYGWAHSRDGMEFRVTFRGMQYLRLYMPGRVLPRA